MGRLLLRARGERVLTSRRRDDDAPAEDASRKEALVALSISTAGSILLVAAPNASFVVFVVGGDSGHVSVHSRPRANDCVASTRGGGRVRTRRTRPLREPSACA